MNLRPLIFSLLLGLATASSNAADPPATPRADTTGIDGIYRGTMGMQLDTGKGKEYQAPSKLVVLPDGESALLSAQHPTGVVVVVMKGQMKDNVFLGESAGRDDFGGYTTGMKWDISFDAKRGTATIHGTAKNKPKWAHDDDQRIVFKKQTSKK